MSGFVVCRANEVLVVSGFFKSKPTIINDGTTFVIPGMQKVQRLSTNSFTVETEVKKQRTKDKIDVNLKVSVVMKIATQVDELLQIAATLFLSKTENEVKDSAKETVESILASVTGELTAEQIMFDKNFFNRTAHEVLSSEFINLGMFIISVSLLAVNDDKGYYKTLHLERIEEAKKGQEAKGNYDSFVARFDAKRKEFEANQEIVCKELTSNPALEKNDMVEVDTKNEKIDKVETTYVFSDTGDMYKGYDWSSADNKYV